MSEQIVARQLWAQPRSSLSKLATMILSSVVFAFVFVGSVADADEPARKYLDALRERGFYDAAIHYLNGASESDLVDAEFKKRVDYEKAKILFDSIRTIRDPDQQADRLNEVDQLLTVYAAKVTDPIESTEVLKFQSDVRFVRGRNYLGQSSSKLADAEKRSQLISNARELLGEAIPGYRNVRDLQGQQIKDFQIDPEDPNSNDKLRALRASYVGTRLRIPEVMEKYAETWQPEEAERSTKMIEAGAEYLAVAKLYDEDYDQGRIAKAWAARCYLQAGDTAKAAQLLREVFEYPSPTKRMVLEGLKVGFETWSKLDPYPADLVIQAADQTIALLNRRERVQPVWLRAQLELARAKFEKSVVLRASNDKNASSMKKEATRLARDVARRRNPHSELAAQWMNSWGISISAAEAEPETMAPPTTFDEARQRGKEQIGFIESELREITSEDRQIARLPEGDEKSERLQSLEQSREDLNRKIDQTLSLLKLGGRLATRETPRSDLNNLRYLQAYCYFAKQRYQEAAVIGSFLLQKYPTIDWSQQAAGLMVRSYERLYDEAGPDEKAAAKQRVITQAKKMLELWPSANDSAIAAIAVTRVSLLENDFETADAFFDRIPSDSPVRSQLASRLGQQIWSERKDATTDDEKQQVAARANRYLQAAVEGVDVSQMDFATAVAALYHVDASLQLNDLDTAIAQIESLMAGLDANETIGKSVKFRQSTYNTALSTFLEAMRSRSDTQTWIDKSQDVIGKLSSESEGDPQAEKMVSAVYRKVARDLTEQFESMSTLPQKQQFADSMMSFFGSIGSNAKDAKTRLWAGATLLEIAESLTLEGGQETARDVSAKAIRTLDSAKKAGFGNDAGLKLQYQYQLALAQRGSGQYAEAVESFQKILETSSGVSLQIDAAKTLLLWGIEENDTNALVKSMNGTGDYRDPKTKKQRKRIWGWKTLTSLTRSNEKFRDAFREAEYYSILCRFRYGQIADKPKAIASAKKELQNALQRFDDLAVGAWKAKYDQLCRDLKVTVPAP